MKLAIAGLIVGSFGLAICIYSTAIDHWCLLSNQKEMFYFGLWRQCMSWVVVQKCKSWSMLKSSQGEDVPLWLQACQLFMILADTFLGFGMICFGLFILQDTLRLYLKRISMTFCIASGVCAFITVSTFGAKFQTESSEQFKTGTLEAGFPLALCGAILGLATGLLIGSHKIHTIDCSSI